jgi:hypothetical protein
MRLRWLWSSADGRPNFVPLALARLMPSANELALELSQPTHHREDQLALRCRGVAPGIIQGAETSAGRFHLIEQVQQIADLPTADLSARSLRLRLQAPAWKQILCGGFAWLARADRKQARLASSCWAAPAWSAHGP